MAEPFASCCGALHEHEHAANGWTLWAFPSTPRRGRAERWGYTMTRSRAGKPSDSFSSAARYGSRESALAAGRRDAEACTPL